jgi:hypothetical protein
MALIKEIDPTAQVCNMYDHFTVIAKARATLGYPKFDTLEGFQRLWDYCVSRVKEEGEDGFRAQSTLGGLIFHGFPHEVDCSNDSPLVGWFLVLGERNG